MKLYRFTDLQAAGIVRNWPQLRNLQDKYNFPAGFLLTPNARCWPAAQVEEWVKSRMEAADAEHA
jgi:predicted DNA-binding transcriptional regulator AlpA